MLSILSLKMNLEELLRDESLTKPLSTIYKALLPNVHMGLETLKAKWVADFPTLDMENWEEMWECSFSQLVSARDSLVQFKILHKVYYTPMHLHKIYLSIPTSCWRCDSPSANFIHIFWSCPQIQIFWAEVTTFILSATTIQVPLSVEVCLLGLVEPLAPCQAVRTLLGLLLYYACKFIVHRWKALPARSNNCWKRLVDLALPSYKATHLSHGCEKNSTKCGTSGQNPHPPKQTLWRISNTLLCL